MNTKLNHFADVSFYKEKRFCYRVDVAKRGTIREKDRKEKKEYRKLKGTIKDELNEKKVDTYEYSLPGTYDMTTGESKYEVRERLLKPELSQGTLQEIFRHLDNLAYNVQTGPMIRRGANKGYFIKFLPLKSKMDYLCVQALMSHEGLYNGKLNGKSSALLTYALAKFQERHKSIKMNDGKLTLETYDQLRYSILKNRIINNTQNQLRVASNNITDIVYDFGVPSLEAVPVKPKYKNLAHLVVNKHWSPINGSISFEVAYVPGKLDKWEEQELIVGRRKRENGEYAYYIRKREKFGRFEAIGSWGKIAGLYNKSGYPSHTSRIPDIRNGQLPFKWITEGFYFIKDDKFGGFTLLNSNHPGRKYFMEEKNLDIWEYKNDEYEIVSDEEINNGYEREGGKHGRRRLPGSPHPIRRWSKEGFYYVGSNLKRLGHNGIFKFLYNSGYLIWCDNQKNPVVTLENKHLILTPRDIANSNFDDWKEMTPEKIFDFTVPQKWRGKGFYRDRNGVVRRKNNPGGKYELRADIGEIVYLNPKRNARRLKFEE